MTRRRNQDRERGAVAVEFALATPILFIIIFGGLHLGRAISARSRVVDAASFAARTESIAASSRPGGAIVGSEITKMVNARMAGTSECSNVTSNHTVEGTAPYLYVTVKVECTLTTVGTGFIGNLGLTTVSASAAMPIDYEPN